MHIQQLSLFSTKENFEKDSFESPLNIGIFKSIGSAVSKAFDEFCTHDIVYFDKTCRSNMLNNLVLKMVSQSCESERLNFVKTLTNTRRSFCLLDNKYIILFKKSPVSNVRTRQDDLLKNQELSKHVLILTYKVDDFWSEISKLQFQYFSSPNQVTYSFDISGYLNTNDASKNAPIVGTPSVRVKRKDPNKKAI